MFHNQDNDISENVKKLDDTICRFDINNNCMHTAPLVRGEEVYQNMDLHARRKILNSFFAFLKNISISYKSFYVEKKHVENDIELTSKLSKQIANFMKDNLAYFLNKRDGVNYFNISDTVEQCPFYFHFLNNPLF